MRLSFLVVVAALGAAIIPRAVEAACPSTPPLYLTLRYEDDYSFLRDAACRSDVWAPVKYVALDPEGSVYASFGADARLRYEYFDNALWGRGVQDSNGYVLQRYLLHLLLLKVPSQGGLDLLMRSKPERHRL